MYDIMSAMKTTHDPAPRFSIHSRLRSFKHAFAGLAVLLRTQQNARVHTVATAAVVAAGFAAGLSPAKWIALVFAIAGVWVAEALNTALEFLADAAHPGYHPLVKKAKDLAAAAVLIAATAATAVGIIVFAT